MSQKINNAISVKGLYGIYNENTNNQFVGVSNINFDFQKNKIYFLVGNSGSGKSTLVNHFNGLTISKYGNISINNKFNIGKSWFINNYAYGVLDEQSNINFLHIHKINKIRSKNKKQKHYLFFVNSLYPSFFIKILFQSIYKFSNIKPNFIQKYKNTYCYNIAIDESDFELEIRQKISKSTLDNIAKSNMSYFKFVFKHFFGNKKYNKIKKLRKEIGLVFQFPEYQLFKDSVQKDIMFGPIVLGDTKQNAEIKAKKYLNLLGLSDEYLYHSPFELSGGQKRRVAIAGILAIEPNILVFDEPTAGLDPQGEKEILNIILNAKKENKTIIVISHNMDHALEIADEVIVMNDGEIIANGDPFDIFMNKELIEYTKLTTPKIIDFINSLIKIDSKYNKILFIKPKNINELANAINQVG